VPHQFNEWRNDQWNHALESLNLEDQSMWRMTRQVMRFPTPSPTLVTQVGLFSQTPRKPNSLEIQFQLVNNQLEPAIIEIADEVMTT